MTRFALVLFVFAGVSIAAPVPKALKKDTTAWGEEIEGLQAGLRMPGGTTVDSGRTAELQVVVRNVSKNPIAVRYHVQSANLHLTGNCTGDTVELWPCMIDDIRGPFPKLGEQTLQPGDELIRWAAQVPFPKWDKVLKKQVNPPAGTYKFEMKQIRGDIGHFYNKGRPAFDRLGTGTLDVHVK